MDTSPAPRSTTPLMGRLAVSLVLVVMTALLSPFAVAAADAADGPPCEVSWDGGGGNNRWLNAANWTGDTVPQINDDVCIDSGSAPNLVVLDLPVHESVASLRTDSAIEVRSGDEGGLRLVTGGHVGALTVQSGEFVTDGPLTAYGVTQSGGAIAGKGSLDVSGSYTWTGGSTAGTGTTTVAAAPSGPAGLNLGKGSLSADQRQLRTTVGGSIASDTSLQLSHGAGVSLAGETTVAPVSNSPGANVWGDGTLDISGPVRLAAHAQLSSSAKTRVTAGATVEMSAGDNAFSLAGEATFAGAAVLGKGSVFEGDGSGKVTLTGTASVTGAGTFGAQQNAAVTSAAVLNVGAIGVTGSLVLDDDAKADTVQVNTGEVVVHQGSRLTAGTLKQTKGTITGDLTVSGAADLADATWTGPKAGIVYVPVGALTEVTGSLTLKNAVLLAKDLTLDKGQSEQARIVLGDERASVDVNGRLRLGAGTSRIEAANDQVSADFGADDLVVAAGQTLVVDTPWQVFADQKVDIDLGGTVRTTSSFVDKGTITNQGTLQLDGDSEIRSDIVSGVKSHLVVGAAGLGADLIDDPVIGGAGADVTVRSLLGGAGTVIGTLTNDGTLAPDSLIKVEGDYVQSGEGRLRVDVADGQQSGLRVSGSSNLAGFLEPHATGTLHDTRWTVLSTGSRTGEMFPDLEADCDQVEYAATKVDLVSGACLSVRDTTVTEGAGDALVTARLSRSMPSAVTLNYTVHTGTAGDADIAGSSGTVTVPAGESTATVKIPVVDDQAAEEDEAFTVTLTSSDIQVDDGEATVTIHDDDNTLAFGAQGISKLGDDQQVRGVGRKYAAGQFENHGTRGWMYSIPAEGIFETSDGLLPTAVSGRDLVAGICGGAQHEHACVRDEGVVTDLKDGSSTEILGINASGAMVGRHYQAPVTGVLYTSPGAAPTTLDPIAGAEYSKALDINSLGTVVGISRAGGKDVIWTRTAAGAVKRAFELPGDRDHFVLSGKISRAGALLVVAETFGSNASLTVTRSLHWTAKGGLVTDDPDHQLVNDMNDAGDQVGTLHARAKLWKGSKVYDLTGSTPQDQLDGVTLRWPHAIGDEGTVVADGTYPDDATAHSFALVPAGAGCYVCAEVKVQEAKFPAKGTMVPAGDEVVEGNPAEAAVELHNTDSVAQTVKVVLNDAEGRPLAAQRTIRLAPDERQTVTAPWQTEGRAWKNGADAGLTSVSAKVTDDAGETVDEDTARIRVVPRPVVLVHREFSNAANWSSYAAKLEKAHAGWKAAAVDTMDTGALGYTISHNAKHLSPFVTKTQTEQNAWQVDLLAEGVGGLVARTYVHRYLKDSDSVTPVRRLLMMGTMNEGTRCATLFTLPGLGELSPRMVEKLNERTFERRGVEFTALGGTAALTTCGWPAVGDDFVSEESALSGVDDTMSLPVQRGQFRSTNVFDRYVLPHLSEASAAPSAPLALGRGMVAAANVLGSAGPAAASTEADPVQLVNGAETLTVAPGKTVRVPETVPSGLDSVTATAFVPGAAASITVRLDKGGVEQAVGNATDEDDFVTAVAQNPVGGSWGLSVTNNGASSLQVPVALAAHGGATTLHADAEQVGVSHKVRVTAHLEGTPLPQAPRPMLVKVASGGGENQGLVLADKGTNGDVTAGDGVYTGVLDAVPDGLLTLDVGTDEADFYRRTTVAAVVETIEDGPGDDAPVAFDQQVSVPAGERTTIKVEAADPEGASLGYEVVAKPAHGKVGGSDAFFEYLPDAGFRGTDSFTFRAFDGAQWSSPATVRITVEKARAQLQLVYPSDRKVARGAPFTARVDVRSLGGDPVGDGKVTFTLDDQVVTTDVQEFVAQVQLATAGLSIGTHDLEVAYDGNATYAPERLHSTINVLANRAPAPTTDPVVGEAGYRTRLEVFDHDPDDNAVKMQVDWENDGTYEETHVVPAQPDGTVPGLFLHTYPAAWDGQARVLVTDADGGTGEVTTSVHVAPHRDQGPLDRVRVNEKPVRLVAISSSGRRVLYEDRNQYAPNHPTSAYGILDRDSGTHAWATVRPDGSLEDNPLSAVLSPDGRWVSWVGTTTANGTTQAMFVRDLMAGTTRTVASPQANLVAVRENRLFVVQQGLLRVIDLTTGTSTVLSRRADGTTITVEEGTGRSAALSQNGRHLVFGVRGGQLWLVDLDAAGTPGPAVRLTIPSSGELVTAPQQVSVSDSGNDVVFTSENADLLPQDTNNQPDVYRLDRSTGTTSLVSTTPGGRAGNGSSLHSSASADGQRVLLWSQASDLVAGDTNAGADVFLRDLAAGTTRRISTEPRDELQGDHESLVGIALSGDGRYAWFDSTAQNLVPDRDWSTRDLFVRDLGTVPPACHLATPADLARTTTEDTAVDVDLPEGCPDSTWSVTDGPQHGTVTGSGAKRSYAPAANWNGTDTFGYRVTHGAESVTGVARITVSAVNDAPVATDVARTGTEDQAVLVTLTGADVDGDDLTYEITSQPGHGTLTGTGATRTFTPVANWNGTDTFGFRVGDGKETSSATARLTLAPVNDAPVAKDLAGESTNGQAVALTFAGTDVDGDPLTYAVVTSPAHGTLSGTGTTRSYVPAAGWSGTDTFTYRVSDGKESSTATVRIAVTRTAPPNRAPVAKDVTVCGLEDQSVKVTLAGTDVDGDTLGYEVIGTPAHGKVSGTGTARTYTPDANWNGTDTVTYRVSDGKLTATGTVRVTLSPVNDAPSTKDVTVQGREDQPVPVTLPGTDVDGNALTWKVLTTPVHGSLTGTTAARVFTPKPNWNGTEKLTFSVSDGKLSATATLTVVVTAVNDAPTVSLTGPKTLTTGQSALFTATTADVDGDKVTCRITWGDGTAATTGCSARHTWSRTGTFTVGVTATDASGAATGATRTVTVGRATCFGVNGRTAV